MIEIDGNSLSLKDLVEISRRHAPVRLNDEARSRCERSRRWIDQAATKDERVYSINTGFGVLSKVKIPMADLRALQRNLLRSHAVGVGPVHGEAEVRALLLLRANALAKGFSGVRPQVIEMLISLLNLGIHPVVPCQGSVGASGDLAPLAHLALVLIGEGEATYSGKRMPGGEALQKAGLTPLVLEPKEGLSLINGTQQMTAWGALTLDRAEQFADIADLICVTSLDGTLGSSRPFSEWIQTTRPHPGQVRSAAQLTALVEGSQIRESHRGCDRVQDPYSFRCAPQVHGACRDLFSYVRKTLECEFNSSTDNPLVHPDTGEITSNGNFHGQPIAFALDVLGMGLAELGSISERRTSKLIDPSFSELPAFLVENPGLNSGYMMAHVTAAALVAENRLLSSPGSTDSIPTNNEKEDHVSMGPLCARKAQMILQNTASILSIEANVACQALEFRKPLQPGIGAQFLYRYLRKQVPALTEDRYLASDLQWFSDELLSGAFYASAFKENLW